MSTEEVLLSAGQSAPRTQTYKDIGALSSGSGAMYEPSACIHCIKMHAISQSIQHSAWPRQIQGHIFNASILMAVFAPGKAFDSIQ